MACRAALLSCLLLLPAFLSADVTLRYRLDYKVNSSLPPAVAQALTTQKIIPAGMTILIKGGKSRSVISGLTSIADSSAQTITLLDPAARHFATVPTSQFADALAGAMPKLPASVQDLMANLKTTADSRVTGRTAEIQGMQAEEHEFEFSLGMPMAAGAPPAPVIRLVMQIWLAKPEEVSRNPALAEFVASGVQQMSGMNPAETVQKLLTALPGVGSGFGSLTSELNAAHSVMLRMHSETFMPMMAMFAQRGNAGDAIDPNAPLLTMDEEVSELSSAAIDDTNFQIPAGYTAVPLADILASAMPKPTPPPAPVRPAITPAQN
jgi:hypothetical protein